MMSAGRKSCVPLCRCPFSLDAVCQLSAFPGPCPPVVRLPWPLPTSCPPSLDLARQLSAFPGPAHQCSAFPGPCPPVVRLFCVFSVFTRQLSTFPRPCMPVVRLPWNLPASCPPSLDLARPLSAFPGPCPPVVPLCFAVFPPFSAKTDWDDASGLYKA